MNDELKLLKPGDYLRGVGTLVEIQEVTPNPQPKQLDYIFRKVGGRCELRLNGNTITVLGSFTGPQYAIEKAEAYVARHEIAPSSDIEVVAIKETSHHRHRPLKMSTGLHEYAAFRCLDVGSRSNVPEDSEEVIWSSKVPGNSR